MPVPDSSTRRLEYQKDVRLESPIFFDLQNPTPQSRRQFSVTNEFDADPRCDIPATSVKVFDSNIDGWGSVNTDVVFSHGGVGAPPIIPATISVDGDELVLTAEEAANFVSGSYQISGQYLYTTSPTAIKLADFVAEFDVKLTLGTQFGFLYRNKPNIDSSNTNFFYHVFNMTVNASSDFDGSNPQHAIEIQRGDKFQSGNEVGAINMFGEPPAVPHDPDAWIHIVLKVKENIHFVCMDGVQGFGFEPVRRQPANQAEVEFYNFYVDEGDFGFTIFGTSDFSRFYGTAAFARVKNLKIYTYIPMLRNGLDGTDPVCAVDIMQYA